MTNTMNNNYTIDYINGTIVVTKKFAKFAGTIGTKEFNEMNELRKSFPEFKIQYKEIKKSEAKKTYKNLTVNRMIAIIEVFEGEEEAENFKNKISVFDNMRSKYGLVKNYFLGAYGDLLDTIGLENDDEIMIETVIARLEKEKKEAELQAKRVRRNINSANITSIEEAKKDDVA